jgi:exosortase
VWVRRGRFQFCQPSPSWIGPAIVLCGWLLYSLGDTFLIQSFFHGGAIVIAVGCLITVLGYRLLIDFFPAFVALGFMVPVPGSIRQQIAIPLQRVTAAVTQNVFDLMGIHVERAGNLLCINGVDVAIAEACNGMRMVFALLLVSYAFAFGTPLRWYVRVLVLVATPISAIVCNVIRLVPTVWLYGNYPGKWAVLFHDLSAWVMLIASFLILMSILRVLRWALLPVTTYRLAYD